ncbi:MAG: diadenylate cyclase [Nitrospirota bacterium]
MARKVVPYEEIFHDILGALGGQAQDTLKQVVILAVEIAREGREGRKIGTMFVVFDQERVLGRSKALIYDPLKGHSSEEKHLSNPDMRETVKELAQLDGAFVVSEDGVVLSACRYMDASSRGISLPKGLGARHMAAASITRHTGATAVVVSESSIVRVFKGGALVAEIIPGIWMLSEYSLHLGPPYSERTDHNVTVVSKTQ